MGKIKIICWQILHRISTFIRLLVEWDETYIPTERERENLFSYNNPFWYFNSILFYVIMIYGCHLYWNFTTEKMRYLNNYLLFCAIMGSLDNTLFYRSLCFLSFVLLYITFLSLFKWQKRKCNGGLIFNAMNRQSLYQYNPFWHEDSKARYVFEKWTLNDWQQQLLAFISHLNVH